MLRILFALALTAHGLGHVMGFLAAWTRVPMGFTEGSWVFSRAGTIASPAGKVWGILWLAVMGLTIAAGVGAAAHTGWWTWLAVGCAAASMAVILPWWGVAKPIRNAAMFDLVLILALAPPWGATIAQAVR